METAIIYKEEVKRTVGVQLTAYIRNLMLSDCGFDWQNACLIADCVERRIRDADCVSLDDGTTLEVTFTSKKGAFNAQHA